MSSIYESIGLSTVSSVKAQAEADAAKKGNNTLGQEEFLSLLTTQLSYQDPTNPVDNSQMVTQLAQLNMVSGIADLNNSVSDLTANVTSSQALMASGLVGQDVKLNTNTAYFNGSDATQFMIDAGSGAVGMKVSITDAAGTLVNVIDLGDGSGDINLYLDGTDKNGNTVPSGSYSFSVTGRQNGTSAAIPVYGYGTVSSVTLGNGLKDTVLNLQGGGTIQMSEVRNFG